MGLRSSPQHFYQRLMLISDAIYQCLFYSCHDQIYSLTEHVLVESCPECDGKIHLLSLDSLHSLAYNVIPIMNCHSSVNFKSFCTLWLQKPHLWLLLFFGGFYQCSCHVTIFLMQNAMKTVSKIEKVYALYTSFSTASIIITHAITAL